MIRFLSFPRLVHRPPYPRIISSLTGSISSRSFSIKVELASDIIAAHKAHPKNNIPDSIAAKVGQNLHLNRNHPLGIIKKQIEDYCNEFAAKRQQPRFELFDNLSPVVNPTQNFDTLLIPPTHVTRNPSDTYYISNDLLLRTHTSAHQNELISKHESFLCSGDVYRRDEVDSSHYPVFHQMEGVRIYPFNSNLSDRAVSVDEKKAEVEADLKELLSGLAVHLFGNVEMRWRDDYFPFTQPSFELDVFYNGDWMEVLGCGVIHDQVMAHAGKLTTATPSAIGHTGWAFGLGLERLAMVLFDIPDIRLFWTDDERFHSQFAGADDPSKPNQWRKLKFTPYSKFPLCYKDVSFWLPDDGLHVNDVYEVIRSQAGDLVERVELFDNFVNPKTKRCSHAYRISYRHMGRSLTNEEVDQVQWKVRDELVRALRVTLR